MPKGAGHVIKWMNADPIDTQQYKSSVPESVHIFVHEMVAAHVAIDAACKLVPRSDKSKTAAVAVAKGIATVRAVQGVFSMSRKVQLVRRTKHSGKVERRGRSVPR